MMEPSKIVLVTGGARSGKSDFAERYAASLPGRHAYVATALASDEEMVRRIALHQKRRPASWKTWEIPEKLPDAMADLCRTADVVLVDCLTIYFSNYMWAHDGDGDDAVLAGALGELRAVLTAFRKAGVTAVLVTNELGSGIVPMERVSRLYRDLIGRINQEAASEADEVYVSVCGITTEWKHRAVILPEVIR
ncbi:bifunctional adenosylcobinamide kinase/adenosylcobinamide-phosphate guanylyltransferase [uncultured Megasphaera sp.]|uniref:bifunctional adenosylcobinamide kinase/adenosylcobinamide-phosphate guanylyltransferase n=1 Tax=uncultured Megasphaera sp. TaxID=165188 RepID=UPI0025F74FA2|nr:bifunctional adenosylcobinamide kinase/adenosylcobinamide-phosphate guanylyltransferase [uncultured Megasphaera sp.]